jgi:hypothetical protein
VRECGRERGRQREEVESECVRVWEGESGMHRGGIESVCVRVWDGERCRQRGEVERGQKMMEVEIECVIEWEGERGIHGGGIQSVCERVWEEERGTHRGYKIGYDGINLNEFLLVSRIIYYVLNKANQMKVEAHMPPTPPHINLNSSILNLSNIKYLKEA